MAAMEGPFSFTPIGIVHSPFRALEDIPKERNADPRGFDDVEGTIEIDPAWAPALQDIDGFSHLIVLFVFHRSAGPRLYGHPPLETEPRGIFSTRSPHRPNPLGLTIVRLLGRRDNRLSVAGLDMLDGTPVLDIKPYTERDRKDGIRAGWMQKS